MDGRHLNTIGVIAAVATSNFAYHQLNLSFLQMALGNAGESS
jgi:hypothetical protein